MTYQDLIKRLQISLNASGEGLTVDGDPGPKTKAALEKYDVALSSIRLPEPRGPITTGVDPDEGTEPWYRRMFSACETNAEKADMAKKAILMIGNGTARYQDVANRLSAHNPINFAWVLGVIHYKEATCDFRGVLHNGEKIIGTGRVTSIVPRGRGPFATWEDAAVDAIKIESSRWNKLLNGSDDVGDVLWALERFNGTGYITGAGKSENSPYLWSCSNINDGFGKYVSDGHFDSSAATGQTVGAAVILKELYKKGLFEVTV